MKKKLFLFILLLSGLYEFSHAQNNWQWGRQATIKMNYTYSKIAAFDKFDNVYVIIPYSDTLILQDTAFYQPGAYYDNDNFALVKFDNNGNFIKALNITGIPNNMLGNSAKATVDNEQNVFITVDTRKPFFVSDIYIEPKSELGGMVLFKVDADFNLLWQEQIYSDNAIPECHGLDISNDNNLYLLSNQYISGGLVTINYFDQDTGKYLHDVITLTKLDNNGRILWRKEVKSTDNGEAYILNSYFSENGSYYLAGYFDCVFTLDGDTLYLPPGNQSWGIFDISFLSNGNVRHAVATTKLNNTALFNLRANNKDNYYFSLSVYSAFVFGNDTLEYSTDTVAYLIGEMDTLYQPVWYKIMETYNYPVNYHFNFDDKNNTISFYSNCINTFNFADSVYNVGNKPAVLYGILSPDGELKQSYIVKSTDTLMGTSIKSDNCDHHFISGYFDGRLIVGEDTLIQDNLKYSDVFVAKINNSVTDIFSFADTTVLLSKSLTLQVPDIFTHVLWSTGDTTNKIILRGDSLQAGEHTIWVEASNESCLAMDTVNIFVLDDSGIDDYTAPKVIIYPNPANNVLNIYATISSNIKDITVYNQTGQMMLHNENSCKSLNVSNLKNGMYYLEFYINDIKTVKKFIKR